MKPRSSLKSSESPTRSAAGRRRPARKQSIKKLEEKSARKRPLPLPLSRDQKRYLRGLGHALEPVIRIGQKGLTEAVVLETRAALEAHELIKVKVALGAPEEPGEVGKKLALGADAEVADSIGGMILLYRSAEDPARRKIVLPRL